MSLALVVAILVVCIFSAVVTWLIITSVRKNVVTGTLAGFAIALVAVSVISAILLNAGLDHQLAVRFMITATVFAFIGTSITVIGKRRGGGVSK